MRKRAAERSRQQNIALSESLESEFQRQIKIAENRLFLALYFLDQNETRQALDLLESILTVCDRLENIIISSRDELERENNKKLHLVAGSKATS